MVDFPDPVAPTIAIFSPFFMVKFMSFRTLLFFVYEKFTFSNFISPLRSFELILPLSLI